LIKNTLYSFFTTNPIYQVDLSPIGVQTKNLSNRSSNNTSKKKYQNVLKSLLQGCRLLEKNKCKFIVIPCNTAHYWFDDLQKKINIPIINMPKEVFKFTKKNCKKNSKVGLIGH
jgi:aspartate racemase